MATIDPLKLLREYALDKKTIKERDNHICFGEIAFPKDVKTNFATFGKQNEYYSLESLLHFYQKRELNHAAYVREAVGRKLQVVTRPDRKDLIDYLTNRGAKQPASIDVTAPIPVPVTLRPAHKEHHHLHANELDGSDAKRARLDDKTGAQLGASKAQRSLNDITGDDKRKDAPVIRDLSKNLTKDKIAELRAKRQARRRTQIKGTEEDLAADAAVEGLSLDSDAVDRELKQRERTWKTRTTCLSASVKNFYKSITPILQTLKAREEAAARGPMAAEPSLKQPINNRPSQAQTQAAYSRYDQERFRADELGEFQIDTSQTYHGVELKSMVMQQNTGNRQKAPGGRPDPPTYRNPPMQTPDDKTGGVGPGGQKKRTSRTPIIVIPAAATSLISMYNAHDILQELRFVTTEDKKALGTTRDNECLIHRRKSDGTTVPFRVVDNPQRLTQDEWERVVAVFVQGPAWQFKGWPHGGEPTSIFQHMAAFHLKYDESKMDANVSKWAVHVLSLSKTRRHLDRATLLQFWTQLDRFIAKNKPHLRY